MTTLFTLISSQREKYECVMPKDFTRTVIISGSAQILKTVKLTRISRRGKGSIAIPWKILMLISKNNSSILINALLCLSLQKCSNLTRWDKRYSQVLIDLLKAYLKKLQKKATNHNLCMVTSTICWQRKRKFDEF